MIQEISKTIAHPSFPEARPNMFPEAEWWRRAGQNMKICKRINGIPTAKTNREMWVNALLFRVS
jgi:hypothetical protein